MELIDLHRLLERPAGTLFSVWHDDQAHGLFRLGLPILGTLDFYVVTILARDVSGWPAVWGSEQRWSECYPGIPYVPKAFALYEPEDVATMVRLLGAER